MGRKNQGEPTVERAQKVLDHLTAFKEYIKYSRLTFKVSPKFITDHTMLEQISSKNAKDMAVERYVKNQNITTSSWIMITEETILNKAKSCDLGVARSLVHRQQQQIAIPIKVRLRTVTTEKLSPSDIPRFKSSSYEVTIGGVKHTLKCDSKDGIEDRKIHIVGPWNPLTGEVELYHFEMGDPQNNHSMLDKYVRWYVDDQKQPISPVAKK